MSDTKAMSVLRDEALRLLERKRREDVDRILRSWAAYINDAKTIRKELGYKTLLGILLKKASIYEKTESPSYDSDFLDFVNYKISNLKPREQQLLYFQYHTPKKGRIERWSSQTGGSSDAYRKAISRLRDDLGYLVEAKIEYANR